MDALGLNSGPSTCEPDVTPLHHVPNEPHWAAVIYCPLSREHASPSCSTDQRTPLVQPLPGYAFLGLPASVIKGSQNAPCGFEPTWHRHLSSDVGDPVHWGVWRNGLGIRISPTSLSRLVPFSIFASRSHRVADQRRNPSRDGGQGYTDGQLASWCDG